MKKKVITKKVTISDLAVMIAEGREETNELARMVAKGFESVDKRFDKVEKDIVEIKKDVVELKENLAATRMDVLSVGDKFVSKHDFDHHLSRFSLLEQKVKTRK